MLDHPRTMSNFKVMTLKELEKENLNLRLKIKLLEKENLKLSSELYELKREANIKDEDECLYKSPEQEMQEYLSEKLNTSLVYFNFSVRAINVLLNMGCRTLGDVVKLSPKELSEARNCGKKTIEEIVQGLKYEGLELGMDTDVFLNGILKGVAPLAQFKSLITPKK